jgi:hypothetical protein
MVDKMNLYSYIIPNEKTFFWKKIDVPEIDKIHNEIKDYFEKIYPSNGRAFNYLDIQKLKSYCPLLFNWTKDNKLQFSSVVLIDVDSAAAPGNLRIHVDVSDPILFPNQLALNFPVVSCIHPDVWTSMYYSEKSPDPSLQTFSGKFPLFSDSNSDSQKQKQFSGLAKYSADENPLKFDEKYCKEISRFQYVDNNPILFNAKIPHTVHNYSKESRVTLSLRFKVDPIWLI